jgi:hypothetical protein
MLVAIIAVSLIVAFVFILYPVQAPSHPFSTTCVIPVESGISIHIVDGNGNPLVNARVTATTTYPCAVNSLEGVTNSNGNVDFSLTPGINYTVTVTPSLNYSGGHITVWTIQAAPPTRFTTVTETAT